MVLQRLPSLARYVCKEPFGQSLPGLAIRASVRRTGASSPGNAMSDQTSDGRTTGMILAQHLAQENPQRDERCIDPIFPNELNRTQCLRNNFFREHIRKWRLAI